MKICVFTSEIYSAQTKAFIKIQYLLKNENGSNGNDYKYFEYPITSINGKDVECANKKWSFILWNVLLETRQAAGNSWQQFTKKWLLLGKVRNWSRSPIAWREEIMSRCFKWRTVQIHSNAEEKGAILRNGRFSGNHI